MTQQVLVRLGVSALAVMGGTVVLSGMPGQNQPSPTQAYAVRVVPCGEFGKPPCGTVVTIPAGSTGESLFGLAKQSVGANRTWEAMIYVSQSANMGYAKAEAVLGADFAVGEAVPKDLVKARYWLQRAADQGDSASQGEVGEFYEIAEGGPPDVAKAIHYYELAAAQHNARAETDLAIDYEVGYGVAHDRAKAISLLRRAVADDRRIGFAPKRPEAYADALSRAGSRRFASSEDLAAFVYPAPRQTQVQRSSVPAGCPDELNFPVAGYMARAKFCSRNPGCPYQVNGMEQTCPRFSNGFGVN